jgi:glyoxylase-like metal-dependent hydrolase (beta-lactamase superfamily II)
VAPQKRRRVTQAGAASPAFDASAPEAGRWVRMAEGVARLVAPNPGPFTQSGTCTYLLGDERLAVIDPGPDDESHFASLLERIGGRKLEAILLTHTHRDHSLLAPRLAAATGAAILSGGPHRAARPPADEESGFLDASADLAHRPDRTLADGEAIAAGDMALVPVATPGHTMNHLCFLAPASRLLFSGDHVMGWSTSIVAPPDGAMTPYLASLRKIIALGEAVSLMLPGHGGPIREPLPFTRALLAHRLQREASVLSRLKAGDRTTAEIVAATYRGLDPKLVGAARLSVFAHLEALIEQRLAKAEGNARLGGIFLPA